MDTFVNESDFALLEKDRYTFNVLIRILRGECDLVLSDHRSLIICHSDTKQGYPIWVWTPDGCGEAEMERAWREINACRPVKDGYRYNLKYDFSDYFMRRAAETGTEMEIAVNMFAYDCPKIIEPEIKADGELHQCTPEEADEVIARKKEFYAAIGETVGDLAAFEDAAREQVARGTYYFWKNGEGKTVGSCAYRAVGKDATVNGVLVSEEYRRMHYARNMVYGITKMLMERGYTPMLYTDADYAASNACYTKIGYVKRGALCTIQKKG